MDDHIARIDQNPIGMGHALDPEIALARLLQLDRQLVGDGADMPVGAAGGNHHPVGQRRLAVEVDGDDVLGLGVFKLGDDGFEERGLLGLRLGAARGFRGAFRRSAFLRL